MAKINATYSSGYYLAPDTDYRKLEEEQQRERKRQRQQGVEASSGKGVIRQTFAMPFNVICLHCNRRIARGTHGYVNRRPTEEKYMGIRIWELEFRCIFCKDHIYLTTDYETAKLTGGYHCSRNCKRGEGDFYGTNQINEAIRAKQATEDAEKGTLDALERENETMRQVQERERLIEELVESKAGMEEEQTRDGLLQIIHARKAKQREGEDESQKDPVDMLVSDDEAAYQRFEAEVRRWQDEAEQQQQQQSKESAVKEAKVAATITAKYSAHEKKRHNAFMEDSDGDGDNDDDACVVASTNGDGLVPTTQSSTTTSITTANVVKRRKGTALASLLDD
ncbi:hypothetical protein DQ04_00341080 [Trypanosoma grayi]|uniref:hypothetical protein n=1 Tax=Trypanosoma grayi TaxID=71804 RepID=UPI0004F448EB|nr:hypothetical protein DQ04_00341080 [Trypanosoma grayi]KEG14693.1 hypothetical protein DQ04_00341080 [Trypanosoma grayi]